MQRILFFIVSILSLSACEFAGFGADAAASASEITLYWSPPLERTNGDPMGIDEIGGYEIRYRSDNSAPFKSIVISDPTVDQWTFTLSQAEASVVEVAVFDTDGIYSDFVRAVSR